MENLSIDVAAGAEGEVLVTLAGELTIYDANGFRDRIADALEGARQLSIDAAGVSEVDLSGIQVLVAARAEAIRRDKSLTMPRLSPALRQALQLLGSLADFGLSEEPVSSADGVH